MKALNIILTYFLILITFVIYSILPAQTNPIILKNKFINLNESIPGTDFETHYKLVDMPSENRYNFSIVIYFKEETSIEIRQPITSTIKEAKPYYGIWLYGGENKIPLIMSAIEVDKSEVPKDRLITLDRIYSGQGMSVKYYKVVFDLNRDYDFTNDKAYYQYFQLPYYNFGPANQIEIPVKYVDESGGDNLILFCYNVDLRLTRQNPTSQIDTDIKYVLDPVIISGSKVFETQISLSGELTKIWLIDDNLNGIFDDNDVWAVDLNRDDEWDINSRFTIEKFKLNEAVNINGKSYLVKEINPVTNNITIAESKIQVKSREIFGVGSKAPAFARLDYLTQKMITSIDFKGQPYVIYYVSNFYDQRHTKDIQYVISILDKYIGLNRMSLIFAFDESNFERIIDVLPPGNKPYYLIKGVYEDYGKRGGERDHILYGFKIDDNTVRNQRVLIAVDKKGIVQYLNKNASLNSVVELCEILKPGSTKGKAEAKIWEIFKRKKKEVIKLPLKSKTETELTLEWLRNNQKELAQVFEPRHIVYLLYKTGKLYIVSKSIGKNDKIKIPAIGEITPVRFPRFSFDRKKLYLLIRDTEETKNHIFSISSLEEPKDLVGLENVTMSFDISRDESQIVYGREVGNLTHIYYLKFGSNETIEISENDIGGVGPAFSPDGKWISYCDPKKLILYNPETSERKILVDDALLKEFPEWSPDGKWIVYQASAGDEFLYDIYKVEVETGKVVRLTKELGMDANPCFNRDGSKIIFMSERDTGTKNQTVYMMNADGTDVKRDVTADTGVYFPRW